MTDLRTLRSHVRERAGAAMLSERQQRALRNWLGGDFLLEDGRMPSHVSNADIEALVMACERISAVYGRMSGRPVLYRGMALSDVPRVSRILEGDRVRIRASGRGVESWTTDAETAYGFSCNPSDAPRAGTVQVLLARRFGRGEILLHWKALLAWAENELYDDGEIREIRAFSVGEREVLVPNAARAYALGDGIELMCAKTDDMLDIMPDLGDSIDFSDVRVGGNPRLAILPRDGRNVTVRDMALDRAAYVHETDDLIVIAHRTR